jgi:hypothetical protein
MLTKPIGPTNLYALTATTGTFTASRTDTKTPLKIRVAVSQPAVINFGTAVADNNSDLLMPANTVEHFTLASTSTVSYVKLTGGTDGYISFTTIA